MRIILLIVLLVLVNITAFLVSYRLTNQNIRIKASEENYPKLQNNIPEKNLEQPSSADKTIEPSTKSAEIKKNQVVENKKIFPSPTAPVVSPSIVNLPDQPLASPTISRRWSIQSVSSMKETKDRICQPRNSTFIKNWVAKAKELGVNYISVETPYDNPICGSALNYTKIWVNEIRAAGLSVWHRHMPLAFEGIYDTAKNIDQDYLPLITSYIKDNPNLFNDGDIFTPIPEPQNGGISGINYCSAGKCYFKSKEDFNSWLRKAITQSSDAFFSIGLGGKIKIGYFGFDGYIVWGDNNPDWNGILEDSTVAVMGNITIDHYPEVVNDSMANDLSELTDKYPQTPIIIGEWGTIGGGDVESQVKNSMGAATKFPNVVGFNYWHMGVGGNEALINEDFSNRSAFDEVQSYFKL